MAFRHLLVWIGITDEPSTPEETLAEIRTLRASFEDTVRRAEAAGETPILNTDKVLREFSVIEAEVEGATEDDLDMLEDRAERLELLRAYVLPREEIALEGKTAFADLSQWGVPPGILATLKADTLELLSDKDEKVARGALRALYAEYDYWSWYVDWFAGFMQTIAV